MEFLDFVHGNKDSAFEDPRQYLASLVPVKSKYVSREEHSKISIAQSKLTHRAWQIPRSAYCFLNATSI